jgi:hypothetical protein
VQALLREYAPPIPLSAVIPRRSRGISSTTTRDKKHKQPDRMERRHPAGPRAAQSRLKNQHFAG